MKRFVFSVPTALYIILLGVLTNFLPAIEPNIASSQYVIESWTVDHGLPQNTVSCILQSSDGYLWLGTGNGAARFDGAKFTVFDMFNTPEFKIQDIRAIFEDKDKNLWFCSAFSIIRFKDGHFEDFSWMAEIKKGRYLAFKNEEGCFFVLVESGVLHYKDGRFIPLESEEGMVYGQVNGCQMDSRGLLWVATDSGVKRFRQYRFEPVIETEGLAVQWVYNDHRGNLWIRTPQGLKRLRNGTSESYDFAQELSPSVEFSCIVEDSHGNCWLGASSGLFRSQKNEHSFMREKVVPKDERICNIKEDQKGNVWVGTSNGLYRYYDDQFFLLNKQHGLSDDYINVIFEDNQENLWLGTKRGLTVLKNPRVVTYSSEEVPGCEYPRSLYQDRQGRIWIMGDFLGIVRYDRGIFERIVKNLSGGKDFSAGGFCEDAQGRLWLGYILSRFEDGDFVCYKNRHGENIIGIRVIWDDGKGCLWVGGSREGIIRIRNGETTVFSTVDGLSHNLVFEITEARDGTVWIGTKKGVTLYKDGIFQSIQNSGGPSEKTVMDIFQDEEGTVWIGTYGGLYRYHDDSFFCYTSAHGLPDDVILGILEDEKGNLWMSSNRGIFFVKKSELHDLASGRIRSLLPVSFDKNDGMKVVECNGGMQPSCLKARDGRLWFPTMKGIAVVDPGRLRLNSQPPPVFLEKVILNGESQVLGGEGRITVPAGQKRIEFHYTAVNFRSPEKVRFRYCLEGYDKQWIEHGSEKERIAHYMNVPGGTYHFQVIACNNDGVWNEKGASIEVRFIPALTETLWFKALALIGLFSILYLIFYFLKRYFYLFAFWKKKTLVGQYIIDRIIGYGGMATVFLAHHMLKKERIVAVKILKREFAARSSSLKRFKQEGSIIDRLDHPHIVKTFERGHNDDNFYIVMEYLQGRTLAEKIKDEKVIKTEEYIEIAKQLADVLAALHGRDIIHRDLKPANIMLVEEDGRENYVKVLDFGLARSLYHTCITESGSLLGTILYIPPEQISDSIFSPAGDIYALGMISCEMLTGTTPYADCPPLEIMQKKLNEASVEPASLWPGIPASLNQLIKRMTDPDPQTRPTAREILDKLT